MREFAKIGCRYIMAALLGWSFLDEAVHHGELKNKTYNGWAALFGIFIYVMLLAGGGFWG